MEVELDIFSGRPNPHWHLAAAQAAEFLARLHGLRPAPSGHFAGNGGLGYRGFILRATGEPTVGPDEVRLYRGTVLARQGDRAETFADPDRSLERWLLSSARGHVPESVLAHVQDEIEHR